MKRTERAIAAFLLAVAVAGGALIPRLFSGSARPLGVALAPGPSRIVVHAPPVQSVPGQSTHPRATPPPGQVAAPAARVAPQPALNAVPASGPTHHRPPSPPPSLRLLRRRRRLLLRLLLRRPRRRLLLRLRPRRLRLRLRLRRLRRLQRRRPRDRATAMATPSTITPALLGTVAPTSTELIAGRRPFGRVLG